MDQNGSAQIKKRRSFSECFPPYVWICFAYLLFIDLLVFYGTRPILPYLPAHELMTPLDEMIPVRPAWITIYVLSFVSWLVTILWILCDSKQRAYRLCGVYTIIMAVSLVCFLAFPVTIRRPEITEGGLFNDWLRLLYRIDGPQNLCPSLHVVISYLCWRCTMGCKRIPKWYQWFNLFFLILVCFCILFVKQHFIADIGAALVITEGALIISRLTRIERVAFAIEDKFRRRRNKSGEA